MTVWLRTSSGGFVFFSGHSSNKRPGSPIFQPGKIKLTLANDPTRTLPASGIRGQSRTSKHNALLRYGDAKRDYKTADNVWRALGMWSPLLAIEPQSTV